ncbi:MAG: chemotaxis protein CheA [Pseudomonadota bacterium]|nr:chemotaxis protein CheA [Pseudomonadota bacterium]
MSDSDYDSSFIAEALPAFISEAREHLQSLEQLLLELESQPGDRDLLDALFRSAHTIKGSAGIFCVDEVVAFTHHVETLLEQLRSGHKPFTPELSTLLLKCSDQIGLLLDAAQSQQPDTAEARAVREQFVSQLRAAYEPGAPAQQPQQPPASAAAVTAATGAEADWSIDVRFGSDLLRNGMDPLSILSYLATLGQLSAVKCDPATIPDLDAIEPESCYLACRFELRTAASRERIEGAFSFVREDCTLQLEQHIPRAEPQIATAAVAALRATSPPVSPTNKVTERGQDATGSAADDGRYIRVQADRLDHVINVVGELVIASAGAELLARDSKQRMLIESTQLIGGLVEELRSGALQLRMVPIGETFARFRRTVRDTATKLGKAINLEVSGGDTELDKSVVEHIVDPLMHLVRNALDHGIEAPAQRVAVGKPAAGTLSLDACHDSGSIVIRIVDDGRGIDRDKVLTRARERGLVPPDAALSDAQVVNLIFEPGFSTADQVTDLSGRGVGMDVVRRNIERLRGTVTVSSKSGAGSCVEIRLPLTLAIIEGFLVGIGAAKFILPLANVVEVVETACVPEFRDEWGHMVAEVRGQLLPVLDLRAMYELDCVAAERMNIVVLQSAAMRFGVLVDTLLGQHQTVIKPLARIFSGLRGISGSTILGSGDVALIFDIAALSERATQTSSTRASSLREPS